MASVTRIGSTDEPYPMLQNVWDFFSEKATKTVFISVGSGNSCLPDLDLAEIVGCPLLKVETGEGVSKWNEIKEILKTRKVVETTSEFAKAASRKWVLPRNILVQDCIPSYANGTIETAEGTVTTKGWMNLVQEHCAALSIEGGLRVDILKVDKCPHEAMVLNSLWTTGFRPSLLLIHWNESPDTSTQNLVTAAHLQMLGYALIGKEGNRYLYFYTDTNYYEVCSWETVAKRFENPLMVELVNSIYPGSEGASISFPLLKKDS
jgi:hypothetical protein